MASLIGSDFPYAWACLPEEEGKRNELLDEGSCHKGR